jgi:hypothetical protein
MSKSPMSRGLPRRGTALHREVVQPISSDYDFDHPLSREQLADITARLRGHEIGFEPLLKSDGSPDLISTGIFAEMAEVGFARHLSVRGIGRHSGKRDSTNGVH